MSNFEISPCLKSRNDPDIGIRAQHIENAIRSADKSNEIVFDNSKLLICTKRIECANPSYVLLTISTGSVNNVNVMDAYKIYPTLTRHIKDLSPVELLREFIEQFGLNCQIANGDKKKLFLSHTCNLSHIPTNSEINLQPIVNINLHKDYLISSIIKWDYENDLISVKYHIGYCLNVDAYSKWVKSRGKLAQGKPNRIKLEHFINNTILPHIKGKTFSEKVFTAIHDFCFYCRQDPESINILNEERIRGIFLIIIKSIFSSAEAESYHYNGKSDFKIINPDNPYEIITGEFKWWTGKKSGEEALHQAIRKHATGQEKDIYTVILSRNKESLPVFTKLKEIYQNAKEVNLDSFSSTAPIGSKEKCCSFIANIRGDNIPLHLCLADLYFKRE